MNLTIEQLAKVTKLSVSTLRVYTSQRNLGKKVGNKRVYTQADVQKLVKSSTKPSRKRASPSLPKRKIESAAKPEPVALTKPKPVDIPAEPVVAKPVKSSFWSRVFGGRRDNKKIGLMDVKTTKGNGSQLPRA